MTPAELENDELLKASEKERIARDSSQPIETIGKVLMFYRQMKVVHAWIRMK